MVCVPDENGYCARHECTHVGRDLVVCLDPAPWAEAYRKRFDMALRAKKNRERKKGQPVNVWRPRRCAHLGEPVTHDGQPMLVRCDTCASGLMLQVANCKLHGQITAKNCNGCKDFKAEGR